MVKGTINNKYIVALLFILTRGDVKIGKLSQHIITLVYYAGKKNTNYNCATIFICQTTFSFECCIITLERN